MRVNRSVEIQQPVWADCESFCSSVKLNRSAELSGSNSVVESQLPKLSRFAGVEPAGEIPSASEGPVLSDKRE